MHPLSPRTQPRRPSADWSGEEATSTRWEWTSSTCEGRCHQASKARWVQSRTYEQVAHGIPLSVLLSIMEMVFSKNTQWAVVNPRLHRNNILLQGQNKHSGNGLSGHVHTWCPSTCPKHNYRWALMWAHCFFKDPHHTAPKYKVKTFYSGTKVGVYILGTQCPNTAAFCAGAQALVLG